MKYFPDELARGMWARYAAALLPLLYLIVALLYSASSAPWGRQVDPEATYAMNGIAWALDGLMRQSAHPGTTTILLVGLVVKLWMFLVGSSDIVEFGLKNYDGVIYASRAAEALVLAGALLASGIIVRNATRSSLAAMLFQVAPFVHPEALHFEVMLIPESLMVSCAILGMALVLKAALDEKRPSVGLGAAQGLTWALGLSSKYLYFPLAIMGVSLFRNQWAFLLALLVGIFSFLILNEILNPLVFNLGWDWLVSLATHKGTYGQGEPGFIDFRELWPNMAHIILAAPLVSAVFAIGTLAALAQMIKSRRCLDPISVTLVASFLAFAAQLVATSKHFALHYMLASWALTGGVLILTIIEVRRLFPSISPRLIAGATVPVCAMLIVATLVQIRRDALERIALNNIGAKLGQAVVVAGPSCANVSSMFVRAPENELNFGADTTFGNQKMKEQFSEAYQRAFKVPLLDHSSYYDGQLQKNFLPFSYPQLAVEYPCIVVRTYQPLDAVTSLGLLELDPDHCLVEGINVYTVGIACEKIRSTYAKLKLIQDASLFR
jgi:hypothetical protein